MKEQPQLRAFYQKYKDKGLVLLSVSLDDTAEGAQETVQKEKMDEFTVVMGDEKVAEKYEVEAIPLNLVMDKDGVIRFREEGPPKEEELTKLVEELLKQLPPEKPQEKQ